jgi:hypothetical protein
MPTDAVYCVRSSSDLTLLHPLRPAGYRILAVLDRLARRLAHDITVTCLTGGHAEDDPHTLGCAVDIRVFDLTAAQVAQLYFWLVEELGPLFYVQLEARTYDEFPQMARANVHLNPHATGPHCHIQLRQGCQYPPAHAE